MACRFAIWPTSRLPFFATATTDGVSSWPLRLGMTRGTPAMTAATTELVVPRSMPMTGPWPELIRGSSSAAFSGARGPTRARDRARPRARARGAPRAHRPRRAARPRARRRRAPRAARPAPPARRAPAPRRGRPAPGPPARPSRHSAGCPGRARPPRGRPRAPRPGCRPPPPPARGRSARGRARRRRASSPPPPARGPPGGGGRARARSGSHWRPARTCRPLRPSCRAARAPAPARRGRRAGWRGRAAPAVRRRGPRLPAGAPLSARTPRAARSGGRTRPGVPVGVEDLHLGQVGGAGLVAGRVPAHVQELPVIDLAQPRVQVQDLLPLLEREIGLLGQVGRGEDEAAVAIGGQGEGHGAPAPLPGLSGRPGAGSNARMWARHLREEQLAQGLLGVQPVLRLVEDRRLLPLEHRLRDLLAPVRRQAVQGDGLGIGRRHERLVDDEAGEALPALGGLGLLPHARPDVGVHDVRASGRLARRAHHPRPATGARHERQVGIVAGGASQTQREAEQDARLQPGVGHVVAVTHPGHLEPAAPERVRAEALGDGEEVGEELAGVGRVGERVHHRHGGARRHLLQLLVLEGADHERVEVTRQDAGGVLDRLPAPELRVLRREHDAMCAELVRAHLERDAGARGGLLEDEPERHPGERTRAALAEQLPLRAALDELEQLLAREVGQPEEVALRAGGAGHVWAFWGAAASAAAKRATASSASAAVRVRAGATRMTSSPMGFTRSPRSRASRATSLAATPSSTTPSSIPRPRTRVTRPVLASAARPSRSRSATGSDRSSTPSASSRTTASATAHASGLPPKVVPWLPGVRCRPTSSVARSAPMGKPPPSALADDMRSGATPSHSCAHHRPVRPIPVWISSRQRSAPAFRVSSRAAARYPSGAGMTPASPSVGSTMNAALRSESAASSAARSPNGTWRTPGTSGSKPCWYFS